MRLFFAPAACSQAVHIALREAGQPFDLVKVDLATHRMADGADYLAINPRGYVPLLQFDDGSRHTEVAALLQHVGDLAPSAGLIPPAGTPERLRVVEWLTFVSSELHKVFSPWLWHKETADSTRKAVKDKLAVRLAELDALLARQAYLAGDAFTVADAYAFTILSWGPMLGIGLKAYPNVDAYLQRIAQRPAVRATLQAEGLQRG